MRQYDIYRVDLDPTIGSEIGKTRPCLIISDDAFGALPSKIIAPITGWNPSFVDKPWMIKVNPSKENGLSKISSIDCYQLNSVDISRFKEKLGSIEPFYIDFLHEVLGDLFSLPI